MFSQRAGWKEWESCKCNLRKRVPRTEMEELCWDTRDTRRASVRGDIRLPLMSFLLLTTGCHFFSSFLLTVKGSWGENEWIIAPTLLDSFQEKRADAGWGGGIGTRRPRNGWLRSRPRTRTPTPSARCPGEEDWADPCAPTWGGLRSMQETSHASSFHSEIPGVFLRAGRKAAEAQRRPEAAAPAVSPPGCGSCGAALTWFLRYQAPEREPLPAPGAPYVKFSDSSSRAAEAASPGPTGANAAMRSRSRRSGSGSLCGRLPARLHCEEAAPGQRRSHFLLGARVRLARRGHLAPAPARPQVLPTRPGAASSPPRRGVGGETGDLRPPRAARPPPAGPVSASSGLHCPGGNPGGPPQRVPALVGARIRSSPM